MRDPIRIELERALSTLAERVEYPPTPPLAPNVTTRIVTARRSGNRPPLPGLALWTRRRVLLAVALGLLALLGIAAIARLTIGAFELRVVPGVTPMPSTSSVRPGDLGHPAALADAEAEAGLEIMLPPAGPPSEVFVTEGLAGSQGVVAAWAADGAWPPIPGTDWGLMVMVFREDADIALKSVDRPDAIRETSVDGRRAYWIGVPHLISFQTEDGVEGPFRVLGSTLIWQGPDRLTYRIETALRRADAIALAESFS